MRWLGRLSRLSRRDWVAAATGGALVAAGGWLAMAPSDSFASSQPQQAIAPVASSPAPTDAATGGPQPLPALPRVVATSVTIPAIGVRSGLQSLRLDSHGALQPPTDPDVAGWYSAGPVPGDRGPAVIAGHLDSFTGPAVFLRLGQLRPGDLVVVHRSDGTDVTFRVQSVRKYAKAAFPSQAVYGPTPLAALRLITCGGAYNHQLKRYPDDVVVFAEIA
jgi:sortase (surface protein transpeptidase)